MKQNREQWSSKFGFIMAASGSAIGLGNLWKFPYVTGTNGGAIFLIVYIFFLVLLGVPILLSEMSVGRYAGMNAVSSCRRINKKWGFVGGIGILGAFTVLSSYSVVGGWVIKYILNSTFGTRLDSEFFSEYTAKSAEPVLWTFVFIAVTAVIVVGGISNGIEKVSSILLPILFVFLIGIMIYSLTLPNASEGVKYFIVPNADSINSFSDFSSIALNAMGQVFFSLSLGMGTLITYGSYLPKSSNLTSNAFTIVILDTLIAIIAGFAIIPAVFSFGFEVSAGPGLIFQTLPVVFSKMAGGRIVAAIFFVLVFFAAITSSISLLEVIVSWLSAKFELSRLAAVIISSLAIFILGCMASLSFSRDFTLGGMSFFEFLSFLSDKLIMPVGGFFICILVGYIWGIKPASEEISNGGKLRFRFEKFFSAAIRYIAPALILIIFISSFF